MANTTNTTQTTTVYVNGRFYTVRNTPEVKERFIAASFKEDAFYSSRPFVGVSKEGHPEGYQGEWTDASTGSNLDRMITVDCTKAGQYFCRPSFDAPNTPLLDRTAYMAKRTFNDTSKTAKVHTSETINDLRTHDLDDKATLAIMADPYALSWYLRNMDDIPTMDDGNTEEPMPDDYIAPQSALAMFPLGKNDKRLDPVNIMIRDMKEMDLKTLKSHGSACYTGRNKTYNVFNENQKKAMWKHHGIYKNHLLPRHTTIGTKAIKRLQERIENNQLTPVVKSKAIRFLKNKTNGLNERDRNEMWKRLKK